MVTVTGRLIQAQNVRDVLFPEEAEVVRHIIRHAVIATFDYPPGCSLLEIDAHVSSKGARPKAGPAKTRQP